jgi:hypothetical protein
MTSALQNLKTAIENFSNDSTNVAKKTEVNDAVKLLRITDFGSVSNQMAKQILIAAGKTVKFEEPIDVKTDFYMKPITTTVPPVTAPPVTAPPVTAPPVTN